MRANLSKLLKNKSITGTTPSKNNTHQHNRDSFKDPTTHSPDHKNWNIQRQLAQNPHSHSPTIFKNNNTHTHGEQQSPQQRIKLRTIFKGRGSHYDTGFFQQSNLNSKDRNKTVDVDNEQVNSNNRSRVGKQVQDFIQNKQAHKNTKAHLHMHENRKKGNLKNILHKNRSLNIQITDNPNQKPIRPQSNINRHNTAIINMNSAIDDHAHVGANLNTINHSISSIIKSHRKNSNEGNQVKNIQSSIVKQKQRQIEKEELQLKKSASAKYNNSANLLANYKINNSSINIHNNTHTHYLDTIRKLNQMDIEAQNLIRQKISKIAKKTELITLKTKGKDQISAQIQDLVLRIKRTSIDHVPNLNQEQVKLFMDRKIRLLQKLLAQNSAESEVLKKYYFAINAINQKNKSHEKDRYSYENGSRKLIKSHSLQLQQKQHTLQRLRSKYESSKQRNNPMVCDQSCFQIQYHSPKPNQYETFRYKVKDYKANLQPFPRSSYKRQYLKYPNSENFSCKNFDNNVILKSRLISSTYNKDFQKLKTQIVDYRQLDSYRNKIKSIQLSYINPSRHKQAEEYVQKSKKYITEQLKQKYNQKNFKYNTGLMMSVKTNYNQSNSAIDGQNIEKNTNRQKLSNQQQFSQLSRSPSRLTQTQQNMFLNSEFKSQFKGLQQINASRIKDFELNNLKYSYKNLINS